MMRKLYSIVVLFVFLLGIYSIQYVSSESFGVPYETYTLSATNSFVQTQTAYMPVGYIAEDLEFDGPSDMYLYDDVLYVADTGNQRIVLLSLTGDFIDDIQLTEFKEPVGVFVKENQLYVADKVAKSVFVIDLDTKDILLTITKPESPIFGQQNEFVPTKVAVDSSDSIYVIGEGSTSGVIQLNYAGEFIGYLGINSVDLSLRKILYNWVVNDSDLSSSRPASPTNVALGTKGSILTTNVNVTETFKRLNITGVNTLSGDTLYPESELSDIWMSTDGYIYMVSKAGDIYEYDSKGQLLFYFNAASYGVKQSLGLIHQASGVVTDQDGNLYILDGGTYGFIHVYQPTAFVELIHQAVTLYNNGEYVASKPLWEEILRQNSAFALAHSALGSALAKEGRFEEALAEFHEANDYQGYSAAYWEIRNVQIQRNLGLWTIIFIGLYIGYRVYKSVNKKHPLFVNLKQKIHDFGTRKLVKELRYSLTILKHPFDAFLSIRRMNVASLKSAWIVFGTFITVYIVNLYGTGYLFRTGNASQVWIELLVVLVVFGLFVVVNYLVSTLADGEGRLRDVFIASSYSLMPFILFVLPMTVFSHVLTYNEEFIYSMYHTVIVSWTVLLLLISITAIHNYTFFETIKYTIIILFGMFLMVLLGVLIYSFVGQLWVFIVSLIKEVIYRV